MSSVEPHLGNALGEVGNLSKKTLLNWPALTLSKRSTRVHIKMLAKLLKNYIGLKLSHDFLQPIHYLIVEWLASDSTKLVSQ